MALTVGLAIDAGSGLLLVAIGAFVASVRPRRAANVRFAVFAISFGLVAFSENLGTALGDPWSSPLFFAAILLSAPALVAIVALPFAFPTPPAKPRWKAALLPGVAALAPLALFAAGGIVTGFDSFLTAGVSISFQVSLCGVLFALVFFAARFSWRGETLSSRRQLALVSAALVPYPILRGGLLFPDQLAVDSIASVGLLVWSLCIVLACGLWIVNAFRVEDEARHLARRVAAFSLVSFAVGVVVNLLAGGFTAISNSGIAGASRAISVALIAYAILKQQLFDIDVKLRWTIRSGTVAAFFLAVFFIVSQLAQIMVAGTGS
ncbi:MAG: hypothetical protein ACYDCK_02615 [Thermoplasmatota archaeon]